MVAHLYRSDEYTIFTFVLNRPYVVTLQRPTRKCSILKMKVVVPSVQFPVSCLCASQRNGVKVAFKSWLRSARFICRVKTEAHRSSKLVCVKFVPGNKKQINIMKSLEYVNLTGDEAEKFDRFFNKQDSMIEVNPGKVILPTLFKTIGDEIHQMPIFESDVWMCSFPRTGIYQPWNQVFLKTYLRIAWEILVTSLPNLPNCLSICVALSHRY